MKNFLFLAFLFLTTVIKSFAQFTKLHDFNGNNAKMPASSLYFDGTYLYGMSEFGGTAAKGNIFKIKPDGTDYQKLLDFTGPNGSFPKGSLISDGTFLYGMTYKGGATGQGIIFKIKPDGTGFVDIQDFDFWGKNPRGSLFYDGSFLYGITSAGGSFGKGIIFKIPTTGLGIAILHDFNGYDGGDAHGALISDGTYLYGTSCNGIFGYEGNVFRIMPDGTNFLVLKNFSISTVGGYPFGTLITDGTYLYGTTSVGTAGGYGSVFKMKTDGTNDTVLMEFNGVNGNSPQGSLFLDGTYLYGMTNAGGASNKGTFFRVKPDGTDDSVMLNFTGAANGQNPTHNTFVSDGTYFYAMTSAGGSSGIGTLFKIKPDGTAYNKLLDFSGTDGKLPGSSLYSDGTSLYGMTEKDGAFGFGTIFKMNLDGTGFSTLMDFDSINGKNPRSGFVSDGFYLYGVTYGGGVSAANAGTIFKIKPDGTSYAKLHDFVYTDGAYPNGSLYFDGTYLYGMTLFGGVNNHGTIYRIKTDGTGFLKLMDFNYPLTGGQAYGHFVSDGTFLYGMTYGGGAYTSGVIFRIKPDGTSYSKLFEMGAPGAPGVSYGSLLLDGAYLYGMSYGNDGIFKIKTDGTGDTILVEFGSSSLYAGGYPFGSLVTDGVFLYGMTVGGSGFGTSGNIFRVRNDGTLFSNLMDFNGPNGALPMGSLIADGSFLYGTASEGGTTNSGTIFKYAYSPNCFAYYETTFDTATTSFNLYVDSISTATATSYLWDFGDGSTSTLPNPTHTYLVDSVFNVCMKIYVASGDSCSYCHLMGVDSMGNVVRSSGFSINAHNTVTSVGLSDYEDPASFEIHPNPSSGMFHVSFSSSVKDASVSVYNSLGAMVHSQTITDSSAGIDLGRQSKGLYFAKVVSGDVIIGTRKLILK